MQAPEMQGPTGALLDPASKINSYADASSNTGLSQTSVTGLGSAQPETQSKPQKRNRVLVSGPGVVGNVSMARLWRVYGALDASLVMLLAHGLGLAVWSSRAFNSGLTLFLAYLGVSRNNRCCNSRHCSWRLFRHPA